MSTTTTIHRLSSPLKWHGGKSYLAGRIVELMPKHLHYVEPFAGGLSVLLAKDPEGVSEVVNDLSGDLTNFWRILRDEHAFPRFLRMAEATPFSEAEWEYAGDHLFEPDPIRRAWAFFVRCRQSLAGRMDAFSGVTRNRTRRGMNGEVSAWLSTVASLPAVHARLGRVLILNARPAIEVIRKHDGPRTLYYLDPPYVHATRATTGEYAHEMTEASHVELLETIQGVRGKVLLSGYPSELYDKTLRGWTRLTFDLPNNAAGGKTKRRMAECLWCNFEPAGGV
jgi:DNA adenine methylase